MSHFDLIDDYLTNRLSGEARHQFEEAMKANSQLKEEMHFQQSVIEGIKNARINQLKTMLNNVPVGGASVLTGKLALAALSVGILVTLTYYLGFKPAYNAPAENPTNMQEAVADEPALPAEPVTDEERTTKIAEENQGEEKVAQGGSAQKPARRGLPKVDLVDPTADLHDQEQEVSTAKPSGTPSPTTPTIEVAVDNSNKTYPFHYQFIADKLVLFGAFNSGLYEVIEINGATQTAFLYYMGQYYHLDKAESNITPLIMIRDTMLINKLNQYRNNN